MADILIRDGLVITMDEEKRIFKNGALAIEGDRIIDVGESKELKKKHSADVEIDAKGRAVLPGLINTHTHFFQNLLKGRRDDLPLVDWVNIVTMPYVRMEFQNYLAGNFEMGYYAALLGCIEALKSGTTCILDMDLRNPRIPEALKLTGIRGVYAINLADKWVSPEVLLPKEELMKVANQIIDEWHGAEKNRIMCMYGPSTPFICSESLLQDIKALADEKGTGIHIHISETKYETDLIKKETGKRPVKFLYDLGFLGSNVSAAHCVWVSDSEINLLKRTGTKVSHNPESNMKLASGVAPIPKMLKMGVTVSLATDGCASNDNLDMFEAMRVAALLHKVSNLDASVISAYDVLEMATIGGAKAMGLENQIGSLEVGKKADVILVNLESAHLRPVYDIVGTLVYCARGADVETVIVDGKIVVENNEIKTVDERDAIQKTEGAIARFYNT